MTAFKLTIHIVVSGYHVYEDTWTPTIGGKFNCWQESDNEDRYTIAVYGDSQDSVELPSVYLVSLAPLSHSTLNQDLNPDSNPDQPLRLLIAFTYHTRPLWSMKS